MNPRYMPSILGLEARRVARDNLCDLGMEICAVKCNLLGQLFLSMLLAYDKFSDVAKHNTHIISLPHSVVAIPVLDQELVKFIKRIINVRTYATPNKRNEGRIRIEQYITTYLSDAAGWIWLKRFGLLHWENSRGRPLFNLDCYMKLSRAALPNASFAVVGRVGGNFYSHKKVAFREPYYVNATGSVYDSIDADLI